MTMGRSTAVLAHFRSDKLFRGVWARRGYATGLPVGNKYIRVSGWMLRGAVGRPSVNNAFLLLCAHVFLCLAHTFVATRGGVSHSIRLPLSHHAVFGSSLTRAQQEGRKEGEALFHFSSSCGAAKPILVFRSNAISVPNMQQGDDMSACGTQSSILFLSFTHGMIGQGNLLQRNLHERI